MAKKKEVGFEVVPLWLWTPKGCARNTVTGRWEGGEYVSGPLDIPFGLTYPGVPVRVKTKWYADQIIEARLAAPVEGFSIEMLPPLYRAGAHLPQGMPRPEWFGAVVPEEAKIYQT